MQPSNALTAELQRRAERGEHPMTIKAIEHELEAIGYRLNRDRDCFGNNRYMTGPDAGHSYPAINTGIKERDTGNEFCHVNARRDANFRKLQDMRASGLYFAVTRGRILEI